MWSQIIRVTRNEYVAKYAPSGEVSKRYVQVWKREIEGFAAADQIGTGKERSGGAQRSDQCYFLRS